MAGADDDSTPPPKTPPKTQHLLPSLVLDNEEEAKAKQQALSREKAAETIRRTHQFPPSIAALIDAYCQFQPRAKNPAIAKWLRKEHKQILAEAKLKLKSGWLPLARKIGRYRRPFWTKLRNAHDERRFSRAHHPR